ncbi:MAG: signal peptide peptidase SppA [Deltaproteobacteria bacterium]|nr:signal peptide peptidase SppA [Deltaproteobacteria bacterium]
MTHMQRRMFQWRGWIWGLTLLAASCSQGGVLQSSGGFHEVLLMGEGPDKILMIDIDGVISNEPIASPYGGLPGMTARIRQELEIAYHDPNIRGILLRINSPGGTLTDSDIIYHSLMEFKKTKKVKIVAAMGDITASGGYYIAMAADEIYAHPSTITGSIGVIMPHMEFSGLMKQFGVTADPVTSGRFKDIDSPYRKRTPDEQKLLQEMVNQQYELFIGAVKQGRPRMAERQIRAIADGRVMTAADAKRYGLIDEIGYLDDAYKRLSELAGFPENRLVRYANTWATGNNIYTNAFPIEGGF